VTEARLRFVAKLLDDMVSLARPADVAYAAVLAVALAGEIDALMADKQLDVPDAILRAARARVEAQQRLDRLAASEAAACESLNRSLDTQSLVLN
jgi:hypothetical protein